MSVNDRSNFNSYNFSKTYSDTGFLHHEKKRCALEINNMNNNLDLYENEEISDHHVINACMTGNLKLLKEYIEFGRDVNDFLITGWTLLLYAASFAQPHIIKYLLNLGADPNLGQEGYTPLMALCYSVKGSPSKRIKCLKYLVEGKADINATNKLKETALMYASKIQETDFILEMLKYNAHINFADSEQRTALFYAVSDNRYDVTKLLIEKGADISWINYRGLSAYDVAVTKGYDKLVSLLIVNYNENEQDYIKTNYITSWMDMFPTMNEMSMENLDNDVVNMLYGMGLECYQSCFRGIDLKTFLKLKEEDLEKLGIDISVHRKRFVDELFRFHKSAWSQNLMKIDKSQPFMPFEVIKMLGNINKQLSVISSSIYYSKNCLDAIEEDKNLDLSFEEKEKLENEIVNIQTVALRIKDATKRIKRLAKIINEENLHLTLPTYIEKKDKRNNHKWIIIIIITIAGVCFFRVKNIKKFWKNEKISKTWTNIFNFLLNNVLYENIYKLSSFLKRYQLL